MERGLQLPRRYHPDWRRYGRTPTMDDTWNDLLQFNCYEAHIPYTMQFFKDHNLAGMAYVHIRQGRIRGSLPKKYYPPSNELDTNHRYHQDEDISKGSEKVLFLQSNTPQNFFWPRPSKDGPDAKAPTNHPRSQRGEANSSKKKAQPTSATNNEVPRDEHFFSSCYLRSDYSPPLKNSSCDVEIDCTVRDIQNVDDVMTSLPLDQSERDKIQWRAVPSLQEIWREERVRMKKLLSPELTQEIIGDVLFNGSQSSFNASSPHITKFTLDVKKNAPRSGTKLATKGMWDLVNVSAGLQEEFLRSLCDIIERHKEYIQKTDRKLQEGNMEKEKFCGIGKDEPQDSPARQNPLQNVSTGALGLSSSRPKGSTSEDATHKSQISTVHSEKIEMVGSQDTKGTRSSSLLSQSNTSIFEAEVDPDHFHYSTQAFSQPMSYSCTQDMHNGVLPTALNPADFSQRMERGDSVLHTQDQDVDDLIDPNTLAPFNRIVFGENCCRVIFKVDSDSPRMIRICGCRRSLCPREGHEFAENRAKIGMYDTITSGMVVDGLLDTSKSDGGDEHCLAVEDYCRRSEKIIDSQPETLTQPTHVPIATRLANTLLTQAIDEDPELDYPETEESVIIDTVFVNKNENNVPMESFRRTERISLIDSWSQEQEETEGVDDFSKKNDNDKVPHWLAHDSHSERSINDERSIDSDFKSRKQVQERMYFELSAQAPSRRDVQTWQNKRKRTEAVIKTEKTKKKKKAFHVNKREKEKDESHVKTGLRKQNKYEYAEKAVLKGRKKVKSNVTENIPENRGSLDKELYNGEHDSLSSSPKERESLLASSTQSQIPSDSQESQNALDGICNQGGRLFIQGGGGLKAKTRASNAIDSAESTLKNNSIGSKNETLFLASPITMMSVEIHVQNRVGTSRLDAKKISMAQDSSKDRITALVYVYARDQGGGESLDILSRGCICLTLGGENPTMDSKINKQVQSQLLRAMPRASMGVQSPLSIDVVKDERHLLRRFKDIVRLKDPDLILSWDTQGAGLGYIIERGHALGKISSSTTGESGKNDSNGVDMAKLLGRTPMDKKAANFVMSHSEGRTKELNLDKINETNESVEQTWQGSGLGSDWDDRVGAGVAAASIVGRLVFAGWKIVAEEVKHPNASYLPAVVFAVLNKRIPHHDNLTLTKWYASGPDRWRTLSHRLAQATSSLLLFDALDIIGRAGEAARLSGVEFSQSFPGIRGSQYKVEGVLLRALQSLRSDERGSKKGKKFESNFSTQQSNYSSGSGRTKSQSQSPWKIRRSNMDKEKVHSFFEYRF